MSGVLGELEESIDVAEDALAMVQPGQLVGFTIGLAAWRTYAWSRLGRWNEMVAAADKSVALWIDADRPSAGYGIHGFIAAVDAARNRREESLAQRWAEPAREILAQFDKAHPTSAIRALVDLDLDRVVSIVGAHELYRERLYLLELGLAICTDRAVHAPAAATRELADVAAAAEMRIIQASALRAAGVRDGDLEALHQALELFQATNALPYVARVQAEIGLIGGGAAWRTGMATLEQLGEVEHVERLRARSGKAALDG
jgi:hypothetical protein